jgi:hypothetical protein
LAASFCTGSDLRTGTAAISLGFFSGLSAFAVIGVTELVRFFATAIQMNAKIIECEKI